MKLSLKSWIERIGKRHWVTFPRCFLLTLGIAFIGIVTLVFVKQGTDQAEWPVWAFFLMLFLVIVAFILFAIGLLGDKKTTEKWARHSDSGAHPEVSILVAVIAAPLYFFLKLIERD